MSTSSGPTVPAASIRRPLFLGVDVGGTNTKIGLVDDDGRVCAKSSIPSEADHPPEGTLGRIAHAARSLTEPFGGMQYVAGVGLGTPGTMDIPNGLILEPPNMPGWRNFPVRDHLARLLDRPVFFANDANAAAYGEYWTGSGRQYHSIILLTLGTGVGGGIIIGDLSVDGENSCGSECGHIIIDFQETARVCGCGQRGHLEAYASATALARRADEAVQAARVSGRPTSLLACEDTGESITPLVLKREAEAGDSLSLELILDTAMYLGVGITSLMHTIDPAAVILGGAMNFGGHASQLGRLFLDRIRQEVRRRAFPVLADKTTIDFASLGGDAGFIGAAGIARAGLRNALH